MTAIMASTVQVKTMADDTLRLTIDIEPQYAHQAFALFGKRGSPCAIARLTNESAVEAMREAQVCGAAPSIAEEAPSIKGGALARLAGIWCNDLRFWVWLSDLAGVTVDSAESAASEIRSVCAIESRAELDSDEEAARRFHKYIREPYRAYLAAMEPGRVAA